MASLSSRCTASRLVGSRSQDCDQSWSWSRTRTSRAVTRTRGYFVSPTLRASRHFDALRSVPAFQALEAEAEAGRQAALGAFRAAGGERVLGAIAG